LLRGFKLFLSTVLAPWHGVDGHQCFKNMVPRWWVKLPSCFLQFSGDPLTPNTSIPVDPAPPPPEPSSAAVAGTVTTAAAVVVVITTISTIVPSAAAAAVVLVSLPPPLPRLPLPLLVDWCLLFVSTAVAVDSAAVAVVNAPTAVVIAAVPTAVTVAVVVIAIPVCMHNAVGEGGGAELMG
jgi:hypothetical protein